MTVTWLKQAWVKPTIHLTLHPFLNSKEDFHYQNIVYALKEAGLQSLQEVQGVQHDTQGVVRPHRHRHFESLDSVTVTGEAAADRCLLHCLRPKSILCCSQLKLRLVVLSVVTTAPCWAELISTFFTLRGSKVRKVSFFAVSEFLCWDMAIF